MKKKIIKILAGVCVLGLIIGCITPLMTKAESVEPLGKLLDSYEDQEGTYKLTEDSRFFIVSDTEPSAELTQVVQLASRQLAADKDYPAKDYYPADESLAIVWGEESLIKEGDIVIRLVSEAVIANEGYKLDVADTADVYASDARGFIYGLNMLQKCFRGYGANLEGFAAFDVPDTIERTVMLDTGRKYYTVEWIKNFIREMSWMGYNALEIHFSEDGGYRADLWDMEYLQSINSTYMPENDFSWLCGSKLQSWADDFNKVDPDAGKYLTTEELVDICNTAKEYHIEIIPSFDSPAHMNYITWQYEQYAKANQEETFTYTHTVLVDGAVSEPVTYTHKYYDATSNGTQGVINHFGVSGYSIPQTPYYTAVNLADEVAIHFTYALYADMADFFKVFAGSTKFNIGGDEVGLYENNATYGTTTWQYDSYPPYINVLNRMLNNRGYTCRMFNDFIGSTKYNVDASTGANAYWVDSNIEIVYWDSPYNPIYPSSTSSICEAEVYWNTQGRTVYNAIQTSCYYVLREHTSGTDARSPENTNWAFNFSTEDRIYEYWDPTDVGEKSWTSSGLNIDNKIITKNLGGAYFLIWNDFSFLNTEGEVWTGAPGTESDGRTYYLLDRMWSNTIKMWNMDIDSSLSYEDYSKLRANFGYCPGYNYEEDTDTDDLGYDSNGKKIELMGCSYDPILPEAKELVQALPEDPEPSTPSEEPGSGSEEPDTGSEEPDTGSEEPDTGSEEPDTGTETPDPEPEPDPTPVGINIYLKTKVNGKVYTISTIQTTVDNSDYSVYLKPREGYKYQTIDGATFKQLASKDGSGYVIISPELGEDQEIVVWYENVPDTSRLNQLINQAPSAQDNYTADSWAVFTQALAAAQNFEVTEDTMQQDVDKVIEDLEKAISQLVIALEDGETSEIISIEAIAGSTKVGKEIGFVVYTTPNVTNLTVTDTSAGVAEELNLCLGRVQKLKDGTWVKVWLVNFDADEAGTFIYSVTASTATGENITSEELKTINVQ